MKLKNPGCFKKGNPPWNKGKSGLQAKENHPGWKTIGLSYIGIHAWLKREYGKATKCEQCNNTNAKRYEWALLKGKNYERKRENFIELCKKCHVKYDDTIKRSWLTRKSIN